MICRDMAHGVIETDRHSGRVISVGACPSGDLMWAKRGGGRIRYTATYVLTVPE